MFRFDYGCRYTAPLITTFLLCIEIKLALCNCKYLKNEKKKTEALILL